MVSDFDQTFPVEQDDLFPSQRVVTDSVRWQSSQPSSCAALNSLILEIPARRKFTHDMSWYDQETSTSTSLQPVEANTHRPLVRTNSRARFGRLSEPDARVPPDLNLFNKKDPMQFLDLLKGVSERVDENVGLRSTREKDKSVGSGGIKRKARASVPSPGEVQGKARVSRPTHVSEVLYNVSRTKGKQRADGGGDTEYESQSSDGNRHTLPSLSSSTSTTASSSSLCSPNVSMSMDVDTSMSISMDPTININEKDCSILPHKRQHGTRQYPPPPESAGARTFQSTSTTSDKTIPQPRLHPLLAQQKSRPQKQAPPKPQFCPPVSSQRAPSLSQISNPGRPPALGIRRTASTPIETTHALPTRQKGFKSPLLPSTQARLQHSKPPVQPAVKAKPITSAAPPKGPQEAVGKFTKPVVAPRSMKDKGYPQPRAPSPELDPDSSFGDMSFDMDVDALEETMRMYD